MNSQNRSLWTKALIVTFLVAGNTLLGGALLREARLSATTKKLCCNGCVACYCHSGSTVCDSLGTGSSCSATNDC